MNYIRAYYQRLDETVEDDNSPIRWIASTEGIKRDGLELKKEDWDLENFRKHPVVLFAHDYMGRNLPIGTAVPGFEGRDLIMDVTYDNEDEFAMSIRRKALKGMMAGSVGWDNVQVGKGKVKHELLEFSMVPVPADPASLPVRQMRAWQDLNNLLADALAHTEYYETDNERPYPNEHACRLREPGDFKDGSFVRTKRKHEGKEYSIIQGKLEGEDTLTDQAFRYPKDTWDVSEARAHCKSHDGISFEPAKDSERSLNLSEVDVWDGVATAMVALYQPESAIEDETRQALYIVLERAYRKLGKTAPEFLPREEMAALSDTELRGLFLEDEFVRAGAVLSARNRGDLEQAITLIQGVIDRAAKEEEKPRNEQDNSTREAIYSIHELFKEFKNG